MSRSSPPAVAEPTEPGAEKSCTTAGLTEGSGPVAAWGRRAGIAVLAVVVLADLLGLLGVHARTTSSASDGYTLDLEYAALARAGLDTPWQARVVHPGGFSGPVTLALTGDYLDIYETQGFHPEPSSETRGAHELRMTFDPPPGDTLVVAYDAYIQPASQKGKRGRLTLWVAGHPVTSVDFHTFVWP